MGHNQRIHVDMTGCFTEYIDVYVEKGVKLAKLLPYVDW